MEMRRGLLALLLLTPAAAQSLTDAAAVAEVFARAPLNPDDHPVACQAIPIKPVLTFGLRLQAGYLFRFPLSLYGGSDHTLTIVTTIAAAGDAPPVYLVDRLRLSSVPQTDAQGEATGSYFLGEGRYRVEWLLFDDSGRACRKHWDVDAALGRADRDIKLAMPPHTVTDLSLSGRHAAAPGSMRLTVLLDAAPIPIAPDGFAATGNGGGIGGGGGLGRGGGGGRGTRTPGGRMQLPSPSDAPRSTSLLHTSDRVLLLGALSALLEQLPASSVRLVVFNLDQQKELYRAETFGMESLQDVGRTMNQLQLGTIDYRTLQNRTGHLDLLAGLINAELRAAPPSDAVIFLGPRERFHDRIPDALLDERHGGTPRFYFLLYQRPAHVRSTSTLMDVADDAPGGRGMRRTAELPAPSASEAPDSVSLALGKLKGKTIKVETPRQFAKAIRAISGASGAPTDRPGGLSH
jgi:hypothetical protein